MPPEHLRRTAFSDADTRERHLRGWRRNYRTQIEPRARPRASSPGPSWVRRLTPAPAEMVRRTTRGRPLMYWWQTKGQVDSTVPAIKVELNMYLTRVATLVLRDPNRLAQSQTDVIHSARTEKKAIRMPWTKPKSEHVIEQVQERLPYHVLIRNEARTNACDFLVNPSAGVLRFRTRGLLSTGPKVDSLRASLCG